jgi:hypothetical protein
MRRNPVDLVRVSSSNYCSGHSSQSQRPRDCYLSRRKTVVPADVFQQLGEVGFDGALYITLDARRSEFSHALTSKKGLSSNHQVSFLSLAMEMGSERLA